MKLQDLKHSYEQWLIATQNLSEHTVRAYFADVSALEKFLGSGFDATKLRPAHIYDFVSHLTSTGRTSTTIRRRLCGIRSFSAWLTTTKVINTNPTAELNLRFSRPRRLPRAVSPTDLRQLLGYLTTAAGLVSGPTGPQVQPRRNTETTTLLAVLLMVGTGMRVGELTQTQRSQVDLPSRTIRVIGKGLRERMVYLSNEWIVSLLNSYLQTRLEEPSLAEPLLVNRTGSALTTSALRTRIGRASTAAGMATHLTPHMLRHTAATQLIESGVDIRFVQRLLGHASLTTTEIYTHIADRSLRHAITEADVLGEFLTLR